MFVIQTSVRVALIFDKLDRMTTTNIYILSLSTHPDT